MSDDTDKEVTDQVTPEKETNSKPASKRTSAKKTTGKATTGKATTKKSTPKKTATKADTQKPAEAPAKKTQEVHTVEIPVEVKEEQPNELSRRIEAGEQIYFKWNGGTIHSIISLEFEHVYDFNQLTNAAKVKVIKSFGRTRKVSHPDVRGYRGLLVDSKYGTPADVTKAKMLNFSNDEKVVEIQDPANWNRNIKIPKMHIPFIEVDVVELISEQEYFMGKDLEFKRQTPRNVSRRKDRVA